MMCYIHIYTIPEFYRYYNLNASSLSLSEFTELCNTEDSILDYIDEEIRFLDWTLGSYNPDTGLFFILDLNS